MNEYPTLITDRLALRQFYPEEAMVVRSLAGAYEIAHGCQNIPHPYGIGMAEGWIACHQNWFFEGSQLVFAVTRREDGWLVGTVELMIEQDHNRAEIGYWIGLPYWGCGYATEATDAVIEYAFNCMQIIRITASYFKRNPRSGRVLEKLGMCTEGLLRKHLLKEGIYEDVIVCGILNEEWRTLSVIRNNKNPDVNS